MDPGHGPASVRGSRPGLGRRRACLDLPALRARRHLRGRDDHGPSHRRSHGNGPDLSIRRRAQSQGRAVHEGNDAQDRGAQFRPGRHALGLRAGDSGGGGNRTGRGAETGPQVLEPQSEQRDLRRRWQPVFRRAPAGQEHQHSHQHHRFSPPAGARRDRRRQHLPVQPAGRAAQGIPQRYSWRGGGHPWRDLDRADGQRQPDGLCVRDRQPGHAVRPGQRPAIAGPAGVRRRRQRLHGADAHAHARRLAADQHRQRPGGARQGHGRNAALLRHGKPGLGGVRADGGRRGHHRGQLLHRRGGDHRAAKPEKSSAAATSGKETRFRAWRNTPADRTSSFEAFS